MRRVLGDAARRYLRSSLALRRLGGGSTEVGRLEHGTQRSKPATITLWRGFIERELAYQGRGRGLREVAPEINVKVVGGINDDKIIAAIRGGNAPDVAQSFTADNAGAFCSSGAWIDLEPYMERDGINDERSSRPAPRYYTQFEGKRCALPMLADAYGLYYNKDLLAKAGINGAAEDDLAS